MGGIVSFAGSPRRTLRRTGSVEGKESALATEIGTEVRQAERETQSLTELDPELLAVVRKTRALAIDLDGTSVLGPVLFPWMPKLLATIRATGRRFVFLTNNSSRSDAEHARLLREKGLDVEAEDVFSSADATILYLKPRVRRIYLLATPSVAEDFERAGFELTGENPEAVVLAFDLTLTYEKLDRACFFVRKGVPFLATHRDTTWMVGPDEHKPDCGALAAAVTAATGVRPRYFGKPEKTMLRGAAQRLGVTKQQMILVGDRLDTDVPMGHRFGIPTVLVLTGKTKPEDLLSARQQPDFVLKNSGELIPYLSSSRVGSKA